jgi:hypothetical protein
MRTGLQMGIMQNARQAMKECGRWGVLTGPGVNGSVRKRLASSPALVADELTLIKQSFEERELGGE